MRTFRGYPIAANQHVADHKVIWSDSENKPIGHITVVEVDYLFDVEIPEGTALILVAPDVMEAIEAKRNERSTLGEQLRKLL